MSRARAVMVLGCTSWAGKSLVATALCRWYVRQGLRVVPFKGQNMSNNARVVAAAPGSADAGEMGVAQWLQARAARVTPDVRMNPVLVKPEHDGSQVVVLGRADPALSALAWAARPGGLWPVIASVYDELAADPGLRPDLVVAEGAGSPAETNLRDTDLANLRVAHHADARALLVADIDRGGAFAHLLGTWQLLAPADRARLDGFVLNRFRGDATLLRDAPGDLTARTGMAHAGVLPMLAHRLPDEDGARDLADLAPPGAPEVAVVRYPTASNLDELLVLAGAARLRWARTAADLDGADLVVLPGSKDVPGDLAWLHAGGVGAAVVRRAEAGARVLGVCGGLQVLGRAVDDRPGLGLLPVHTRNAPDKLTRRVRQRFADRLPAPWAGLAGTTVDGYDIRHGRTVAAPSGDGTPGAAPVLGTDSGWATGSVLGVACHGLLEDPAVVAAVLPGTRPVADPLEATLDGLADAVEEHLDTDLLRRLTGGLL
ncbi:cobyric acid synthase [Aquipuribacter sp. SD81]|uniref:cobyric acid synthase n=1 Tax=Aquipuribacter sp. SD81 TaxID=3127703 RepID=UPI003018695B